MMWEYPVLEITKVVDGDTVDCRISLGFAVDASFSFRLAEVDTPEIFGPRATVAGHQAKEFTEVWLASHPHLKVRTVKPSPTIGIGDAKFGRWLAYFLDAVTDEDLSDALRVAGFDTGRR